MSALEEKALRRKFMAAAQAAREVMQLESDLRAARFALSDTCRLLHDIAPVRSVAKQCGFSAASVSNLWRGHVSLSPENVIACINAAQLEVNP